MKLTDTTMRIICGMGLFVALATAPWWATLLAIAVGFFCFTNYYEGLFACLIMDALYGMPSHHWFVVPFSFTGIVLMFAVPFAKKRLMVLDRAGF